MKTERQCLLFGTAPLNRVAQLVESHKPPVLPHIRFFRAQAVVLEAHDLTNPVFQFHPFKLQEYQHISRVILRLWRPNTSCFLQNIVRNCAQISIFVGYCSDIHEFLR